MATARKTASGNYRCLVYSGKDENGKRIYKSFTAKTKKEAERMAIEYERTETDSKSKKTFTLHKALDRYIENRRNLLSPSTLKEYCRIRDKDFCQWQEKDAYAITNEDLQRMVNELSAKASPKTVRNRFMLIESSLKELRPELNTKVLFPQKKKPEITIPTEKEVKTLLDAASGTSLYWPIALAAYAGLRRSEICALKEAPEQNFKVKAVKVLGEYNIWEEKDRPKSTAGCRTVHIPTKIFEDLKEQPFVQLLPNTITKSFRELSKKVFGKIYRFHDLRHFYASYLMSIGMPNTYIQERIGHATDNMLKNVYLHTLSEKQKEFDDKLDEMIR